jgi:hypothetical protein
MRQFTVTVTALAVLGAMVVTAQAENQTSNPRTVSGPVTVSQVVTPQSHPRTKPLQGPRKCRRSRS